jgi:protein ImuB
VRRIQPVTPPRPLRLFRPPEHIDTLGSLGQAPQRFRWRRVEHVVTSARGPERLEPEWWRGVPIDEGRDYFWLQDGEGRRFWVYRAKSDWFLHGLFA